MSTRPAGNWAHSIQSAAGSRQNSRLQLHTTRGGSEHNLMNNGAQDHVSLLKTTSAYEVAMGTEDLHFYSVREPETRRGCFLGPAAIVGLVFLFVASLLIVGLSVGLAGRPTRPRTDGTTVIPTAPPTDSPDTGSSYRLPKSVVPDHYQLEIKPVIDGNPEDFIFKGKVTISVRCVTSTYNITVNMDGLSLNESSLSLTAADGTDIPITSHIIDIKRFFLIVNLEQPLTAGHQYNLSMEYTGVLLNNLIGLYYGSYQTSDGLVRGDDWQAESFQTSVPMSSYLLAMYVGDFKHADIPTDLPTEMRVWARADGLNQTDYAQMLAEKEMGGFQEYFNISYALPKIDHIGLPEMGPGAMENYGLITYRETLIIVENSSTPEAKQSSAFTLAHEIGHQWFGNYVTMEWWDDIWLNEGFANFCEYIGVDAVFPDWKPWEQFIFRTLYDAMTLDSLRNSRVIRHDANTPDEISANFDTISYKKGSSIVRMLRDVMGAEIFRKGISKYLKKHAFGNTVSDDLWESLSEQMTEEGTPLNVTAIMHTWTLQMGYPLLTVSRDYVNKTADVGQTRFLLDTAGDTNDPEDSISPFGYLWAVPITYKSSDTSGREWLHNHNGTIHHGTAGDNWLLVNVRRHGMYRVNYDPDNWKLLTDQLMDNHQVLPPENRAQILDDALALAKAGLLSQTVALNITRYLRNERDLVPWRTVERSFELMREILSRTSVYGNFKRYMVQLVSSLFDELLPKTNGSHLESMLRLTIVNIACLFEHEDCVRSAIYQYEEWMKDPDTNVVPTDFRETVYCTAIRAGGEREWNFAWNRFRQKSDPVERAALRNAMACTQRTWLLSRYLEWAFDTSLIKRGESDIVIVRIAQNPVGRALVWQFLQENWGGAVGEAVYGKKRIADEAFNGFYTKTDLEEVIKFRDKYINDHANAKNLIFASVEKTHVNYRWMSRDLETMGEWFAQATGVPDPTFVQ